MTKKEPQNAESSAELRRKAEELAVLRESPYPAGGMSIDEMRALLHDLEVHQIELELQNEELRRAHQELQAARNRYSDLFDFAPIGYFLLDRDLQIIEANLTGSRLLDVERRTLFKRRLTRFVMPSDQDTFYKHIHRDGHEDGRSCELMMHRRDGGQFFAELKIAKEPASGNGALYRVAVIDITERKRLRDELESHVQERTEQLRRMTGQLALTEQRERQRLSKVLHDGLQQILVGAKYRLAFVERGPDVHQAASEVQEIIDEAIETSRSLTAELSPPVLRTRDFASALEWLAHWMRDKQGLEVDLIAHGRLRPFTTEASLLLFHATRELLFNVVKHSGVKKCRVEIEQSQDQILLKVEDEGSGFDTRQLHSEKRQSGGAGLMGVKERISYIGGGMVIDSAPGRGSRFLLIAPLSILAGDTESAIREEEEARISVMISPELGFGEAGTGRRIRIMLADDHLVMRQGLAGLLRGEPDFEIVGEASDGEAAVRLAGEVKPDVVLMDISMPYMDGVQATRIIHRELPDIRIIGLSMFQEPGRESAIRDAGAVGYVTKSGPSEAVMDAIRACMSAT